MKMSRRAAVLVIALAAAFLGGGASSVLAVCGPFTDVSGPFCPFILQLYYQGITSGTSATTFSPTEPVTRAQAAAFLARTMNLSLAKASRRAALDQWWTPQPPPAGLGVTVVGSDPRILKSDGLDIWVPNLGSGTVSRVRASDGKLLETWTGAMNPFAVLVAIGRVFVTGSTVPGALYMIDPTQSARDVTTVASNLGSGPQGIAFDGARIWTANSGGSVSIVAPGTWIVTTVTTGFVIPWGAVFDGSNVWVTDRGDHTLKRLDGSGAILQTVTVGSYPAFPVFDGTNIWVPNTNSDTVTVVRASTGTVLNTLSGNGLSQPLVAAFDGQRILIVESGILRGVSFFRAADLSFLDFFAADGGIDPFGACSDGLNFWISFSGSGTIARL